MFFKLYTYIKLYELPACPVIKGVLLIYNSTRQPSRSIYACVTPFALQPISNTLHLFRSGLILWSVLVILQPLLDHPTAGAEKNVERRRQNKLAVAMWLDERKSHHDNTIGRLRMSVYEINTW